RSELLQNVFSIDLRTYRGKIEVPIVLASKLENDLASPGDVRVCTSTAGTTYDDSGLTANPSADDVPELGLDLEAICEGFANAQVVRSGVRRPGVHRDYMRCYIVDRSNEVLKVEAVA